MRARGFVLADGLGDLSGQVIRIGHIDGKARRLTQQIADRRRLIAGQDRAE